MSSQSSFLFSTQPPWDTVPPSLLAVLSSLGCQDALPLGPLPPHWSPLSPSELPVDFGGSPALLSILLSSSVNPASLTALEASRAGHRTLIAPTQSPSESRYTWNSQHGCLGIPVATTGRWFSRHSFSLLLGLSRGLQEPC